MAAQQQMAMAAQQQHADQLIKTFEEQIAAVRTRLASTVAKYQEEKGLSSRIRFMLQDLRELRVVVGGVVAGGGGRERVARAGRRAGLLKELGSDFVRGASGWSRAFFWYRFRWKTWR